MTDSNERPTQNLEAFTSQSIAVLQSFDRLPENPDDDQLKKNLRRQLNSEGKVNLTVFACPSYSPEALLSENPENYVSDNVKETDLFLPRVPKLKQIMSSLIKSGVPNKLTILIGDTDPQYYVLPVLREKFGITCDEQQFNARLERYAQRFAVRARVLLGDETEVYSLNSFAPSPNKIPTIPPLELEQEIIFFRWLFSEKGPYKNRFELTDDDYRKMSEAKFKLYADQGWLVSDLTGGIILQTETPWLLRTQMLQSTGAPVCAIYPWIRKEELVDLIK